MPPAPTRATRRRWSAAGAVVAALTVALVAPACRDGGAGVESAASSTTTASTTTTAPVDPSRPRTATGAGGNPRDDRIGPPADNRPTDGVLGAVGACFVEYLEQQGDALLHRLALSDCNGPHDAEVFAVLGMDAAAGAPFPGETETSRRADGLCLARFSDYVGREYATSSLRIAVLRPTATTWAAGDRQVVCSVYDQDLEPLTGPVRNSNR